MDNAELLESVKHSQNIARRQGHNQLAVEVYGWALTHWRDVPVAALNELMALTKEPE